MSSYLAAAKRIKVFLCDSDGVMFANTVLMGAPFKAKSRSYYDGQGVSLLRAIGIHVAFITNEHGPGADAIRETVAKFNMLPSSQKATNPNGWPHVVLYEDRGGAKKIEAAQAFLDEHGWTFEDAAFMGDDLVDVPLLKRVSLPAAPAQAEAAVRRICSFVSERDGGGGAIRDFANMVLEARGIDPFTLPPQ